MQKSLLLEEIRIDGGTQLRAEINEDYVGECAAVLQSGGKLPPADVFHDGANYWLADGFHRRHAHAKADLPSMKCEIHIGTLRDAILFAAGANAAHGLQRTAADKRKTVAALLSDDEWSERSINWIAEACKVSDNLVNAVLKEMEPKASTSTNGSSTCEQSNTSTSASGSSPPKKRKGKDGKKRPEKNAPILCERCQRLAPGVGVMDCPQCAEMRQNNPKKKKKRKKPEPPAEVKDATGAFVPDNLRDVFADTSLRELVDELRSVETMLTPGTWAERAGKLSAHYPFILVEKANEHAWNALQELQTAIANIKCGLAHAVCPKCNGMDSKNNGKTCKTCRGCGHIPEHRFNELATEKV